MSNLLDNLPEGAVEAIYADKGYNPLASTKRALSYLRDNNPAFLLAVALSEEEIRETRAWLITCGQNHLARSVENKLDAALALHKGENDG
jgi:hypothetical protein